MYEWHLRRAFTYIVGHDYPPALSVTQAQAFLVLPWGGKDPSDDDRNGIAVLLQRNATYEQRALWSTQLVGIARFLQDIAACRNKEPVIKLGIRVTGTGIHIANFTLTAGDLRGALSSVDVSYFNLAMLMHYHLAAMAPPSRTATVDTVDREMRRFLHGMVTGAPTFTTVNLASLSSFSAGPGTVHLSDLLIHGAGSAICTAAAVTLGGLVPPHLCALLTIDDVARFKTGDCARDNNYYAAAIDRRSSGGTAQQAAIDATLASWHPYGTVSNLPRSLVADHNPHGWLGNAFAWEREPDCTSGGCPRRLKSGSYAALPDGAVSGAAGRNVDALRHGAGLDFLLPTALLLDRGTGNVALDADVRFSAALAYSVPEYLPACTTSPLEPEAASEATDLQMAGCTFAWTWGTGPEDAHEADTPSAVVNTLGCGQARTFQIERSTLYSKQGTSRRAPYPFRFYRAGTVITLTGNTQADRQRMNTAAQQSAAQMAIPVWNTDDIDYFSINCNPQLALNVDVTFPSGQYNRVVVDHQEYPVPSNGHLNVRATMAPTHLIKITGDTAHYQLRVDPTP